MSLLPEHTYAPNLYEFGDNIEVWAKKALELIPTNRLIIVGCSVGGSCALEVAHLANHRVAALVLIGTKARHDPSSDLFRRSLECVQRQGVEAAWQTYWEQLFQGSSDKKVAQFAREIALNQTKGQLMNGLTAFHTRPSRDKFVADYDFPIHVVTGAHDTLPGLAYSRELVATAKQGQLHIIESCGHYVPMVQATKLNVLLEDVIRKLRIGE